ncbi:phenylalanine--tRNA ligase subunit beta [Paenibacillus radicis (ex Gao et al. 2016)]|uniref:Phenylalanine--tRNA ligase beta subunit n=1 Tax=Paenibacillus radicis (ex Gao et al. 2016) TaxID=1737354 RepID=A0A917HVN6_9BACL|nr:phenylalanine--tRNA ligase subunit beta [Paenibacillus radicis (ex Gao et al. 2016)]GGG90821.1 phenylalanine--tRNA ligase beta subunit [Paenibacillus radicis (ex Gao et al. 2016)]
MKVSYKWLNEYVELSGFTAEELAEKMTRGGIEIDSVESLDKGVSGVVVGYVKSREKHPDADKLNVCKVDVGTGEELQIVCGAKNVEAGQRVPVATIGAVLPGDFRIKRAKLRGVESQGMICSAKELGLNDKLLPKEQQEGILVLPESTPIGTSIGDVLGIHDEVLELDLTPNRSDCLSMLGVAYEIGALTGRPVKLPENTINHTPERADSHISVSISAPEHCSHYSARYIKGVKIGPSPLWLQNRLIAAGIRPISNVVDVTNFVMLEYGQPLHAFDADAVQSGKIEVRFAKEGESLVTLDDQERRLEPHMLVITDGVKPIGLAGVMGGANSEVNEGTVNILLESAKFDGGTIRKTSRQLGLRSESSIRFEKEVDPARVIPALDRAAALIAELAEGLVTEGIVEEVIAKAEPAKIDISLAKINGYLGTELSKLEVQTIFERLNFGYSLAEEGKFTVQVPTRRGDITRDVDLIEEVARLHGYDNIPTTPIHGDVTPGALTKPQAIRRDLRRRLTDAGLHEVISYSFTSPERTELFPALSGEGQKPVKLAMPMSEDRSVLRTTLVAQLLETAVYNRNRKNDSISVFEIGSVFHTDEEVLTRLPQEKHRFAALLTGSRTEAQWNRKTEPVDFYDAKGVLETLFQVLGLTSKVRYEAAQPENFHPGRTAAVVLETARGPQTIGYVGQLHPTLQHESDLADTYVLEIELDELYEQAQFDIGYKALPRYPAMQRDIAVVLERSVPAADLTASAWATAGELLESVRVFDVFTGEKLGADKKSVALSLVYRHADRTLTDEEVTELHGKVVAELEQSFAAELRK